MLKRLSRVKTVVLPHLGMRLYTTTGDGALRGRMREHVLTRAPAPGDTSCAEAHSTRASCCSSARRPTLRDAAGILTAHRRGLGRLALGQQRWLAAARMPAPAQGPAVPGDAKDAVGTPFF